MDAGLGGQTAVSERQLTPQASADIFHMVIDPANPWRV